MRQRKAGSGAGWRSRFGPARLGAARSGQARRSRSGTFCHGPARLGLAVVVGLGVMSQLESWRDGLGEVCCVRATLGLSGRSWCVLTCCGNARQQRECGGRGNSPLCGQGGLGGVCFCASGCGSFGLGEAVKVRSGRVGSGEAVLVRREEVGRVKARRSRSVTVRLGAARLGEAVMVMRGTARSGELRRG